MIGEDLQQIGAVVQAIVSKEVQAIVSKEVEAIVAREVPPIVAREVQERLDRFAVAMNNEFTAVRAEFKDVVGERTEAVETKLLNAFYGFAKTQQATTHRLEASDADIVARMAVLEARVLALEESENRRRSN